MTIAVEHDTKSKSNQIRYVNQYKKLTSLIQVHVLQHFQLFLLTSFWNMIELADKFAKADCDNLIPMPAAFIRIKVYDAWD